MHESPFHVGQLVESRTFATGYRGAWFRCKLRDIRMKNGVMQHLLEYIDYPDQKLTWIKVYQKPPYLGKKSKSAKSQPMVRPDFPPFYCESEKPNTSAISGVVVLVDDAWKVGDLVDWLTDGCYWSAKVNEILEDGKDGKVKIDLLPPPMGEGLTYEALTKDIRPSLDWCPERGWTVPSPTLLDGEKRQPCARLIKPGHSGDILNTSVADETAKVVQTSVSASFECSSSYSSHNTEDFTDSLTGPSTTKDAMELDVVDTSLEKTNSLDGASSPQNSAASIERTRMRASQDESVQKSPSKYMKRDEGTDLDSQFMNSIEPTILDLEDLVNKVKWIRGILEDGMPLSSTNPSFWEFCEHDAHSTQ